MNNECAKCKADSEKGIFLAEGGNSYWFCVLCREIIKKNPTNFIQYFLQPDSSKREDISMTPEERKMLQARERRAQGNSPWMKE